MTASSIRDAALQAIIAAVREKPDGVEAAALIKNLKEQGLKRQEVELAIQRALDRGLLQIGSKMHLVSKQPHIAA
jgi:hypothetical protein